MRRDDFEESATTTTSANAGAYTKPLGYSSKSIPVLVDNFSKLTQDAISHTSTGRKRRVERRKKNRLMTMID